MKYNHTARGDAAVDALIEQGWTVDHTATAAGYIYAGTIRSMRTRKGVEFCRVYHSKCYNLELPNGYDKTIQVTTVMRRQLTA